MERRKNAALLRSRNIVELRVTLWVCACACVCVCARARTRVLISSNYEHHSQIFLYRLASSPWPTHPDFSMQHLKMGGEVARTVPRKFSTIHDRQSANTHANWILLLRARTFLII